MLLRARAVGGHVDWTASLTGFCTRCTAQIVTITADGFAWPIAATRYAPFAGNGPGTADGAGREQRWEHGLMGNDSMVVVAARPYQAEAGRDAAFVRLGPAFNEALAYVAEMHREQARKGIPVPYLSHLLGVASLVLEYGGDENQAISALLHDTIEDCGNEHAPVIEDRFGPAVLALVRACSDDEVPAGAEKRPWRNRKEEYLAHLDQLGAGHPALLVSAADKLHNARAIRADLRQTRAFRVGPVQPARQRPALVLPQPRRLLRTAPPRRAQRRVATHRAGHRSARPGTAALTINRLPSLCRLHGPRLPPCQKQNSGEFGDPEGERGD